MSKKIDIRFLLFQVYNIHELVFENHYNKNYNDAILLLDYELKKYRYIKDNSKNNIAISTYYLEYANHFDTKINDVLMALNFYKKKKIKIKGNLSNETLKKLYILQTKNLRLNFDNLNLLSQKTKTIIYYILIYLYREIKKIDLDFHLTKNESLYLLNTSPFKSQLV